MMEKVSTEGKFLLFFCAIILLSPYLISIPGTDVKIRPDHIMVPLTAWILAIRGLYRGIKFGPQLFFISIYILWLLLVSLYRYALPPFYYPSPSFAAVLGYLDAALRPLYILLIVSAIDPTKKDLSLILKFVMTVSIPIFLVGIGQLMFDRVRQNPINHMVYAVYDFGRDDDLFWQLLENGRSMSIFGQSGTFGMFSLFIFTLAIVNFAGGQLIKSKLLNVVILCLAVVGGMASGSKVFIGGAILFVGMAIFAKRPVISNLDGKKVTAVFALIATVSAASFFAFSEHSMSETTKLLNPTMLYDTYLAPRFGAEIPSQAKLARTGAFETSARFPVIGIGLLAVPMTVDSAFFAIITTCGVIGLLLFGLCIYSVLISLVVTANMSEAREVRLLAGSMAILTLIFIGASLGFHVFTQDRIGDIYWIVVSILCIHLAPTCYSARQLVSSFPLPLAWRRI